MRCVHLCEIVFLILTSMCSIGTRRADVSEEVSEHTKSFVCPCCYNTANIHFDCGHLCCTSCIPLLTRNGEPACSTCKAQCGYRRFDISQNCELTCQACWKPKEWITNCGHVTCTCTSPTRCPVCNTILACIHRAFLT